MKTIRNSKKRQAIYDALCLHHGHPSAEMLYESLKDSWPDLSLGTVYRNLAFFLENKKIVCVATINGHARYDSCLEQHSHFVCHTCGSILDVPLPDLAPGVVYRRTESMLGGGEVFSHQLTFYGICPDCLRRQQRKHYNPGY